MTSEDRSLLPYKPEHTGYPFIISAGRFYLAEQPSAALGTCATQDEVPQGLSGQRYYSRSAAPISTSVAALSICFTTTKVNVS